MGKNMSYTLAQAAAATGVNKTTILRAIKRGKITGTKDALGKWQVEAANLHCVYPAVAERGADGDAAQLLEPHDAAALEAQIDALISRAEDRLHHQLHELHRDKHAALDHPQVPQRKPTR